MILKEKIDEKTGLCKTGIEDGGSGPYVLGVTFLGNVVTIFDVENERMQFTRHDF